MYNGREEVKHIMEWVSKDEMRVMFAIGDLYFNCKYKWDVKELALLFGLSESGIKKILKILRGKSK